MNKDFRLIGACAPNDHSETSLVVLSRFSWVFLAADWNAVLYPEKYRSRDKFGETISGFQ